MTSFSAQLESAEQAHRLPAVRPARAAPNSPVGRSRRRSHSLVLYDPGDRSSLKAGVNGCHVTEPLFQCCQIPPYKQLPSPAFLCPFSSPPPILCRLYKSILRWELIRNYQLLRMVHAGRRTRTRERPPRGIKVLSTHHSRRWQG